MELNEMEKRMLYQTEGSERYALMHELLLASRYAKDPDRRRAADSLMEKIRPLTDRECMEIVHDIRKNYRLPREGRTMGELLAEARQKSGAEQLKGHDIMALERKCGIWLSLKCFQRIPLTERKATGCACS